MVGVPKSTGCIICRKRKIKCDETWPVCTNCQKNGKCCPGQPARHTFRDVGPKLQGLVADELETSSLSSLDSLDSVEAGSTSSNTAKSRGKMTIVNEKWSNGCVYHKWRICASGDDLPSQKAQSRSPSRRSLMPQQPSLSVVENLARALVEGMSTGGHGYKLSTFGSFITDVPRRLGQNAALDAAVACLVSAQASLIRRKSAEEITDPKLYLSAVQNLQLSLEDPIEGLSSNTLCATVLLSMVEAMAGPRRGNRYLTHVGGARRLIQLQGPQSFQDSFAKDILRFNRGSVIIHAIYQRRPCFLVEPEWLSIAFDTTAVSDDDALYTEVLLLMAQFPSLLSAFAALESPPSSTSYDSPHASARAALLARLLDLKRALYRLELALNPRLADGRAAIELPSLLATTPVPTSFHFTSWRVAVVYACFWSLLLMANKLLLQMLPSEDPCSLADVFDLEQECRGVSAQICKMWEDAWARRPIGAFHTGLSALMSWEWCEDGVREWVVEGQNRLLEEQMGAGRGWRWDAESFGATAERLVGAVDGVR